MLHYGHMSKERLENFTDAVFAILMTILVLELHAPSLPAHASFGEYAQALGPLWPQFFSFSLSFFAIAVYWINHHYFFRYVRQVTIQMMWLNVLLLFIVAFIPFSTSLLGTNPTGQFPIVFYACNTLLAGAAFYALRSYVYRNQLYRCDANEAIRTFGPWKSVPGVVLSALAIAAAFINIPAALVFLSIYPAVYAVPGNITIFENL